ncbi:MAG TPA: metal ABC transporter permease [Acidimicrobiales bacterium]|jgi:zinc/manganese transport system permease protein
MFASFMVNTWVVGTIVAIVAGVVGFFVVLRGSSFVAHAIPNAAFAGAAGASLLGASTVGGLLAFAVAGALGIGALSSRGRHDVATALAVVTMLGLGSLFLSFSTQYAPEIYSLLFGEVLGISSSELAPTMVLGVVTILAVAVWYRPFLLTSVTPELAEARGVHSPRVQLVFLLIVAVATTMAVPVVGALLMFSLMIGPPAAARCFTTTPLLAIGLSVVFALVGVWAAIALSYVTDWPIGFFVGVTGAASYLLGRAYAAWHRSRVVQGLDPDGPPAVAI